MARSTRNGLIGAAIGFGLLVLCAYLGAAFVMLSLNPGDWDQHSRSSLVAAIAIFSPFVGILGFFVGVDPR